jgi:hypothetical protein
MSLDGIILETWYGFAYDDSGSWSIDVPLVPPPALQPVPFVAADAGLSQLFELDSGNLTAFFVEYGTRDSETGLPKTVTVEYPTSIIMDSNVDSVTISLFWEDEVGGIGVHRILLFY